MSYKENAAQANPVTGEKHANTTCFRTGTENLMSENF